MTSASLSTLFPLNVHFTDTAQCRFANFTSLSEWTTDINEKISMRVMPILLVLGLISNGSFLFTLVRVPSARTTINAYLTNLAVADSLQLMVTTIIGLVHHWTIGSQWIHMLFLALSRSLELASNISIFLVAVERYYAICCPIRHRVHSSRSRNAKLMACMWLVVAVVLVFLMVNTGVQCNQQYLIALAVNSGLMLTLSLVVLLGVVFLYSVILRRVRGNPALSPLPRQLPRHHNQLRVFRMVLINTLVFCILNLVMLTTAGLIFVYVLIQFSQHRLTVSKLIEENAYHVRDTWYIILVIEDLTVMLNSLVDPLVYTCSNEAHRAAFKEAFKGLCCNPFHRRRKKSSPTNKHGQLAVEPKSVNQIQMAAHYKKATGLYFNVFSCNQINVPVSPCDQVSTTVFATEL